MYFIARSFSSRTSEMHIYALGLSSTSFVITSNCVRRHRIFDTDTHIHTYGSNYFINFDCQPASTGDGREIISHITGVLFATTFPRSRLGRATLFAVTKSIMPAPLLPFVRSISVVYRRYNLFLPGPTHTFPLLSRPALPLFSSQYVSSRLMDANFSFKFAGRSAKAARNFRRHLRVLCIPT